MSRLQQVVAVLGRGVVPPDTPVVGADDLGLTRGHGCFDATRVRFTPDGPTVDALPAHLDRLARSAAALGIPSPDASAWTEMVEGLCSSYVGEREAALKMVLTGGGELSDGDPVGYATLTEIGQATLRQRDGISVATLGRGTASDAFAGAPWLLGGVKSIAYAVNLAAQHEARDRGADDALFVSTDGYALEGPTSAVVIRRGSSLVTTPTGPTGVLASITVDRMAEAASGAGVSVERALFTPAEIRAAEGAWLVSSVRGVAPIRTLDGDLLSVDAAGDDLVRSLAGF